MLICYFRRQRIGAYLDGALGASRTRSMAAHLERCAACRAEAEGLGRLRAMLKRSAPVGEPDWTGFWQGIVRGIEAPRREPARRPAERIAWRPRLALAGALVAGLVGLTLWQVVDRTPVTDGGSIIQTAQTDYPGGSVMVYSPAGGGMTVIWVFGAEKTGTGAL